MFQVVPAIYTCAPCDKKCKAYINARHRPEQHGRFILQKYSGRLENLSCCYNSMTREQRLGVMCVRKKKKAPQQGAFAHPAVKLIFTPVMKLSPAAPPWKLWFPEA